MASIEETSGAKTQLGSNLAAGVETLSLNQEVTFTLYVKLILPLDGYVFWVNAALLKDDALLNASQYNMMEVDKFNPIAIPPKHIQAKGSFHVATELHQLEDRTTAYNHITFTSLQSIQDFNLVNPSMMYVAKYLDNTFAFSRRDNFYVQADLYHYRGDALYSIMNTQLIDSITDFDFDNSIVSNSLPVWLTLNQFFPMYPSYLVGQNIKPPYATVDINPSLTQPLQSFPLLTKNSSHYQLVRDTVKISIFGTRNFNALEFQDYVFQYSLDTDNIGILNMPVVQDEKVTQPEFGIIAMKKTITFEVSYYQQNIQNIARQLIESALISVTVAS